MIESSLRSKIYLAGVDVLCDGGCTNGKMFKK